MNARALLQTLFVAFIVGFMARAAIAPAPVPEAEPILQTPPPPPPPIDTVLQAKIADYDAYFRQAVQSTGTPGAAVVIAKDSQIVFLKGYGLRNARTKEPVDEQTVFRLGSLSKGFAGILAGILVEKGQIRWTDKVKKYYPAFSLSDRRQAERMEIRHLLSHTTGLPYQAYTNLLEEGHSLDQIARIYFPKSKLFGKEGAEYAYQNVAFSLIDPILAQATGLQYGQLLQDYIFTPARMQSASCSYETILACSNLAVPHSGMAPMPITPEYYGFAPAGGVNASIADMGEWLKLLLGYKPEIISNSALDQVFEPVISTGKERSILPGWIARDAAFYAMGWRVLHHESDTLVYHAGCVNNYQCEIAFDRKKGIGICVLSNAVTGLKGQCIREFFDMQ